MSALYVAFRGLSIPSYAESVSEFFIRGGSDFLKVCQHVEKNTGYAEVFQFTHQQMKRCAIYQARTVGAWTLTGESPYTPSGAKFQIGAKVVYRYPFAYGGGYGESESSVTAYELTGQIGVRETIRYCVAHYHRALDSDDLRWAAGGTK